MQVFPTKINKSDTKMKLFRERDARFEDPPPFGELRAKAKLKSIHIFPAKMRGSDTERKPVPRARLTL